MKSELSQPVKAAPVTVNIDGVMCVTVDTAAEYLDLKPYEVRNLVNYHRRLEAVKVGTAMLITADSLETERGRRNFEKTQVVA